MTYAELPPPAGFPFCTRCAYMVSGPLRICGDCAGQTLAPIPDDHCPICSQTLRPGGVCGSILCGWADGTGRRRRAIARIDAVAQYTDPFQDATGRWPITAPGDPALVRARVTAPSKDRSFPEKEAAAWEHTQAISSTGRYVFRGRRILLIDDVCTTGLQLNYIAGRLRASGAVEVRGLVLARTQWRY